VRGRVGFQDALENCLGVTLHAQHLIELGVFIFEEGRWISTFGKEFLMLKKLAIVALFASFLSVTSSEAQVAIRIGQLALTAGKCFPVAVSLESKT